MNLKKKKFTENGTKQDVMVPWNKFTTFMGDRYYHMFKSGELESLCKTFDDLVVVESAFEKGNCNIVLQKMK